MRFNLNNLNLIYIWFTMTPAFRHRPERGWSHRPPPPPPNSSKLKHSLLLLGVLASLILEQSQAQQTCAYSQILLNNECVDCNALLHGCTQCSLRSDSVSSLQCDTCDFEYYLLSVATKETALDSKVSICVERCEDFAYNWVSNDDTRRCEYCGPTCTLCSPKYGCLADYTWDRNYKYVDSSQYPIRKFPFSAKVPSTKFGLTQACADSRCDKCQINDAVKVQSPQYAQCDSCPTYVTQNFAAKQALLPCYLCDSANVSNCLNCDPDVPSICISCKEGYFIDRSVNQCLACASDISYENGCRRCDQNSCLECLPGYYESTDSKGRTTCSKCNLESFNAAYDLEPNRCTQCVGVGQTNKCKYCDIGFLGSTDKPDSCELKCSEGQYPVVAYITKNQNENLIDSTVCTACNSVCGSCVGPEATDCTSCRVSEYLSIKDIKRQTGVCLAQLGPTAPHDIFVSNSDPLGSLEEISTKLELSDVGTFTNPFYHLDDALERAKELAAESATTNQVNVTIHLFKGDHYLVMTRGGSTLPHYMRNKNLAGDNLNYRLTIKPLACSLVPQASRNTCYDSLSDPSTRVTLFNKRREKMRFDVAVSLTLQSIIIDGIDSILHTQKLGQSLPDCLNERRQCCNLSHDTGLVTNFNSADSFNCTESFELLFKTMETDCFANSPRSLFKMRLSNEQDGILAPNSLTIHGNSEVRNIFYAMNSLVAFTSAGGKVRISKSYFSHLHICGSIIKDSFTELPYPDIQDYVNRAYLTADQVTNIKLVWNYQTTFSDKTPYQIYMDVVNDSKKNSVCLGLDYCTQIVINEQSTFSKLPFGQSLYSKAQLVSQENGLRYQGYVVTLEDSTRQSSLEVFDTIFKDIKAPMDGCAPYESLTSIDQSRVEPVGSMNNWRQLMNPQSDFNKAQIQGPFIIRNHHGPVIFWKNSFFDNISFGGVISVDQIEGAFIVTENAFSSNSAIYDSNTISLVSGRTPISGTTTNESQCGGIEISNNKFTNSMGCSNTVGTISTRCLAGSGWLHNTIMDTHYFGENAKMEIYDNLASGTLETIVSDLSLLPIGSISATSFTVSNNDFSYNFAGTNTAVVSILGYKSVSYDSNNHFQNENWIANSFRTQSTLFRQQQDDAYPVAVTTASEVRTRSKAIVHVRAASSLVAKSNKFENNFVLDMFTPVASSDTPIIQSNGILIQDLDGSLDLSNSIFTKNSGLVGNNRVGIYPVPSGFSSRLIALESCSLKQLFFDNMTFSNNKGELQLDQPTQTMPQLFSFDQSTLSMTTQQVIMRNLQVTGNEFLHADSIMTFKLQNLLMEDLVLTANKCNSIIIFEYLNDRAVFNLKQPSVSQNEVRTGSTFLMHEAVDFELTGYMASKVNNLQHFEVTNGDFRGNFVAEKADRSGLGPRSAVFDFSGRSSAPWAHISLDATILKDNLGVVTNDFFVDESVKALELTRITWTGSISLPQESKKAQVIYRPPNFNFDLTVQNSKFTCTGVTYESDIIMENDISSALGRTSLFRLGQAQNVEVMPVLQKESKDSGGMPDGYLNSDEFTLRFERNTYTQCNHVERGSVFYLEEGARLYEARSDYGDCSALMGGLAYVTGHGTYLKIELPSAQMTEMFAYQGAILFIEKGATVEMTNNVVVRYTEAYEGTIAFITDRARLIMDQSIDISYNQAHRRGLFYVSDGSQVLLNELKIFGNKAGYDSVVLHAENNRIEYHMVDGSTSVSIMESTVLQSWIDNAEISRNSITNQGRLVTVIESNVTVSNSQFKVNDISTDNYGIYASYAEMEIINCQFVGPADPYVHYDLNNKEYSDVNGAFLQVQENSRVWVSFCEFTGGRSIYGGCILQQGYSRLKIEDSDFYMCTAEYGGAIYASAHRSLEIRRSNFTMNYAFLGYGQNVYSVNVYEQVLIEQSTFKSYHNSIYSTGYSISLIGCTLEGDGQTRAASKALPYHPDGGALHIVQTARIIVKETDFRNLRGRYGGALYIAQDRLTTSALTLEKSFRTMRPYYFSDVKFENCVAEFDGGAIYVVNPLRMTVRQASFFNNIAGREGGAVQYKCEPTARDLRVDPITPCDFVFDEVQFTDNQAFVGGAIRWNLIEMEVGSGDQDDLVFQKQKDGTARYGSLRFQNNKAMEYGPEIASVARELIRFEETETYLKYYSGTAEQRQELVEEKDRNSFFNDYVYSGIQSGGEIPTLYLGLIDKYGQLVSINRGSKIEFLLQGSEKEDSEFETKILGVTDFFSAYGTYNMSGMGLITAPKNRIFVKLAVKGVDLNVPSNRYYLGKQLGRTVTADDHGEAYDLNIKMVVRGCILGEGLRETGACYECPKGTYLLEAPTVPTDCIACIAEKTYCLGGKKVGPKPGFWRASASSYNFWPCPEPSQCLGMDVSLAFDAPGNANGLCDIENGYYGVMCTACLPGFKRAGLLKCEPCLDAELLKIVIIMVGLVVGICYLVKVTIRGAAKASDSSVFNKILMNHLQMLIITSDFDMDWPPQVLAIFNVASPINELTEAIVNFDCFMDTRTIEDVQPYNFNVPRDEVRVYSQKVIIMAFLPALLGMIAWVVWWIICRIKQQMEVMYTKFIATLVLLLFLVHPALTKRMVDVFNCTSYDGVLRLNSDYQVQCYEDPRHFEIAYYVALPALLIWGLGIPATVFTMMRKKEDLLTTENVKQQFGFLYNGYKRHNYYWEIVIMYRKIMCIFIAVFLRPQGVIVQALVLLIMLGIFLQANNTSRPFKTRQLNDIENMSVATQIITIYCGIFFISAKERDENFIENRDFYLGESGKIMLVMVIAFCNSFFILLWIMKFLDISREMIKRSSEKIYVYMFLCGRWDKLEKETARRAAVIKREKIIASIEDTILYLKKMMDIYANNSFYEDHDRFLRLLYHIEFEQNVIDLTEKRNNFYIQGKMARDRKFDRERMREVQNEQSLEVDEHVVEVMEEQRVDAEEQTNDKIRLQMTPFYQSIKKVKAKQSKKVQQQNASSRRMMTSQRTLLLPRQHTLRSFDFGGSSMSLTKAKSAGFGSIIKPQRMQSGSSDLQPQGSPEIQTSIQTQPMSHLDIDSGNADMAESPEKNRTIESPQDFSQLHDLLDRKKFKQVHLDAQNNIIVDTEDDEDGASLVDGEDGPVAGKRADAESAKDKSKGRKKKGKEIYLEAFAKKSRNQKANLIKVDAKNNTVGKVISKERISKMKQSVGQLASLLKSQFTEARGDKKKDDLYEEPKSEVSKVDHVSHIQEFFEVDESFDSNDKRLYELRQLTYRDEVAKTDKNVPRGGGKNAMMSESKGPNSDDEMAGGAPSEGPNLALSVKSGGQQTAQDDAKGEEEGKDKDKEEEAQVDALDLGPNEYLRQLQEQQPENENAVYEVLRPRNIPRRLLHGVEVCDTFLDHSDSFRTMQTDDAEEGAAAHVDVGEDSAPEKSITEPPYVTRDVKDEEDGNITPRKQAVKPSFNDLEMRQSPESKFSIQMSPTKDEKDNNNVPEQKKRQKPKVRVADHDHLHVPLVENFLAGIVMPRYEPKNFFDQSDKDSPAKDQGNENELKVYDDDHTPSQMRESSSSLHTDPSMRDYDFNYEPDQNFNIFLPQAASLRNDRMGSGLGVMGTKNAPNFEEESQELSEEVAGDKQILSDAILGPDVEEEQVLDDRSDETPTPDQSATDVRRGLSDHVPRLRKSERKGITSK